jgi:O6-methylguanine-DNA--protein-cysteine methyltransferase
VAIVETRYDVPGWGFGELWRRDGIVLAHDFRFAPVSDTVSDTKSDGSGDVLDGHADELVGRFRAFLRGEDVSFANVAIEVDWATPFQRALVDALRAVPRGEVVSCG